MEIVISAIHKMVIKDVVLYVERKKGMLPMNFKTSEPNVYKGKHQESRAKNFEF